MGKGDRKIEVKQPGAWIEVKIQKGDVFRMFEPNGDCVCGQGDCAGMTEFRADEDARLRPNSNELPIPIWGVKAVGLR